jgi:hypothetical protein
MRKPIFMALLGLGSLPALGEDVRTPPDPAYRAECGSCHVAYPPQLLPAASWRALMTRLDRHFGVDASLDAKLQADIGRFLETNAGRRSAAPGAEPRITETPWFRREHRGEIPPGQNPANCGVCHARAEDGYYDEH